jgi:hypothetical protein
MGGDIPQSGFGNWKAFDRSVEDIFQAAKEWKTVLGGIERPWLIWHVSDKWTKLQQRLVQSVGWTPVIGKDPRASVPTLEPGAVFVDFNHQFGFPVLFPHFAIDFSWLCVQSRFAFWHSDLLCRLDTMQRLRDQFEKLTPGQTAAVFDLGGRRNFFARKRHRYWELAGCTTVEAGRSQFESGTGWWMHIDCHPNCKDEAERAKRREYYWDHGVGILYWKRNYGGQVVDIPEKWLREGHCSSIQKPDYVLKHGSKANKELSTDLDYNYDVVEVATRLGIRHLLD